MTMYVPRHFEGARVDVLHQLIRVEPFAILVTLGPDRLDANRSVPMPPAGG